MRARPVLLLLLLASSLVAGCGGGGGADGEGDGGGSNLPPTGDYVVLAWNDLGMHCFNPRFDADVILPPYNTLQAQVVRRGSPPAIVTSGITVSYRIVGNTYSYGKRDYGTFWDNLPALFGTSLPVDTGLNLVDPAIHNGLSGTMVVHGDRFSADGIPLTPVDDALVWNPYQVAEVTVKDLQGAVLALTRATVPTSDEIHCDLCHRSATSPSAPELPYLAVHDRDHATSLATASQPFLCVNAGCHGSPVLGQGGAPGVPTLSQSMHQFHGGLDAAKQPACYNCHPGEQTQCNRSLRHTAMDGNCTTCHGSLQEVGNSIAGGRVPWVDLPKCATCHGGSSIPEVDTGATRYRDAVGHGGLGCPACHQSPHAMVPSREPSDNYQAIQYMGAAVSMGSCAACHASSHGRGLGEFGEAHGGTNPEHRNACHVCHTSVSATPTLWPHQFKWIAR
jgi:hypothetical protein